MALATLLGTPLAGAILLSRNGAALGDNGANRLLLPPAAVVGLGLAWWAYQTPDAALLWAFLSAVMAAAFSVLAWNRQGGAYREHLRRGGRVSSKSAAAAVGLACALPLLGLTHLLHSAAPEDVGGRVDVKDQQSVYFARGGTEGEATDVGKFLGRTPLSLIHI